MRTRTMIAIKTIIIGVIFIMAAASMGSCSSCSANKWRKKRYVYTETHTDTIPQYTFVGNQILILR